LNEACASLPGLFSADAIIPGDVFDGMRLQQLRLRADQQVPKWGVNASIAGEASDDAIDIQSRRFALVFQKAPRTVRLYP
jgi:hypothetical protein